MSELYKDPTPIEAANTHGELVQNHADSINELGNKQDHLKVTERREHFLQELQDASSIDEVNEITAHYDEPDNNDEVLNKLIARVKASREMNIEDFKDALKSKLNAVKLDINSANGLIESADTVIRSNEASIKEYADRFEDKLHTAALAMAALDGVQINHPDAIEVKNNLSK
jgi:hypothetical protein